MSSTRIRSDSMFSVDGPDVVNDDVMAEEVVLAIQGDDVDYLRKQPASTLKKSTSAKTLALHEAAEANAVEVTKFLIEERGHAVDAVDDQCWTPLHYAAAFAGPELVHLLLSHGASPEAEDDEGDTALDAHLDESDAGSDVAKLLESVAAADDYEEWARAHARAPGAFGEYAAAARPHYVVAAVRHELAVLHRNALKQQDTVLREGVSAEAFLLGAHGGHVAFDHLLGFMG
mmetsp:Transcript_34464/g.106515  ORF Transcript_34464/g.106515 Transcript_34464/m.106515 type:complete len:231 (-) Transcript_34464:108-800(-)